MVNNFVPFVGITEFVNDEEVSESESEEEDQEVNLIKSYKEVRETLINIGKENQNLIKEKTRLEALVVLL